MNTPSPAAPPNVLMPEDARVAVHYHLQADGALDRGLLCAGFAALNTRIAELEAQLDRKRELLLAEKAVSYAHSVAHGNILARAKQAEASVAVLIGELEDMKPYTPNLAHAKRVDRVLTNLSTSAQAHLAELRNAALEEAAKVADEVATREGDECEREGAATEDYHNAIGANMAARKIANAIRALKSTQEPTQS